MNKKIRRNLGISALAVLGCVACSFGVMGLKTASAEENAFDTAKIEMIKGASVRYYSEATTAAESGIRFSSAITAEDYTALEAMETEGVSVSYGMLIAPYSYFDTYGEFNPATVFGVDGEKKYTWDGETVDEGATYTKIAHVTYDTLTMSTQEGYENHYEIRGSLIKILDENLTKDFIGRGYIKYETTDSVSYKFADYYEDSADNNVRSIVYVSQLAIEANDPAAAWVSQHYVSKVVEEKTTYTIATYVGEELVKTNEVEAKVNAKLENVAIAEYQGYTNVSAETTGTVYANGNLILKHVYEEIEGTEYQVKNGGFETGDLTDWVLVGNIGAVSSEQNYWKGDPLNADGFPFGLDGTYMFSAYEGSELERNKGTLKSSTFTVSESGWISYKLGGAKNSTYVHVDVVEAATGNILKRYYNQNHKYEVVGSICLGCELNWYKANLQDCIGKEVYLRVSDYASADFGLFFLDSVDTLHLAEPNDQYMLANEVAHENTIYDLYNGNFDRDMDGWTKNSNIGDISESTSDWFGEFDNVGKYFSCYAPDQSEGSKDTLQSNVFEVGGSGYITYRIGGVKNPDQVYMEVVDALTGVKYAHYYNEYMRDCALISYKADLSAYIGKLVYINFVDNATGDYGLIFCDEFVTYYANEADVPAYNVAVNKVESIYNVMNGGFETGNLLGWTLVSGDVPGRVTDINYFWNAPEDPNRVIGKDGNFSFTGVELNPANGNLEGLMGTLRSNTFILKANSSISFKMGGSGADRQDVCLRIVNAATGEVVAWYSNPNRRDATLNEYNYSIGNTSEMICYVEIVDNATANWGLLGLDSINVYQA